MVRKRANRFRLERQEGTALVEFALMVPILLTFLSLAVNLGYSAAHRQAMEFAAGQGAFAASLYPRSRAVALAREVVLQNRELAPPALSVGLPGDCPDWNVDVSTFQSGDSPLPPPGNDVFSLAGLQARTTDSPGYVRVVVSCHALQPMPLFIRDVIAPAFDLRVERIGRLGCWRQLTGPDPCV